VSGKRKPKAKKQNAKPDIRIQGIDFREALRAILNTPPVRKLK
jgi:hypothetical protein